MQDEIRIIHDELSEFIMKNKDEFISAMIIESSGEFISAWPEKKEETNQISVYCDAINKYLTKLMYEMQGGELGMVTLKMVNHLLLIFPFGDKLIFACEIHSNIQPFSIITKVYQLLEKLTDYGVDDDE